MYSYVIRMLELLLIAQQSEVMKSLIRTLCEEFLQESRESGK